MTWLINRNRALERRVKFLEDRLGFQQRRADEAEQRGDREYALRSRLAAAGFEDVWGGNVLYYRGSISFGAIRDLRLQALPLITEVMTLDMRAELLKKLEDIDAEQ